MELIFRKPKLTLKPCQCAGVLQSSVFAAIATATMAGLH